MKVIKRGNAHISITSTFKLLDVSTCNYLAPPRSLSDFLKSFNIEERKQYFPYEFLTTEDELSSTSIPLYECFYSRLKGCNVLEDVEDHWKKVGCPTEMEFSSCREKYKMIKGIWVEKGMRTMKDYLSFCNIADVTPLLEAIEALRKLYEKMGVDILKDTLSIPGVARTILYGTAKKQNVLFLLFSMKDRYLYLTMKQSTIAGPSIIFKRFACVGLTSSGALIKWWRV